MFLYMYKRERVRQVMQSVLLLNILTMKKLSTSKNAELMRKQDEQDLTATELDGIYQIEGWYNNSGYNARVRLIEHKQDEIDREVKLIETELDKISNDIESIQKALDDSKWAADFGK